MTEQDLQKRLSHQFVNPQLLRHALTHRSTGAMNNERLEFLGDAVLNCAVATLIYSRFSKVDEGDLSRIRANLVKQQTLFEIAQNLHLSKFVQLGEGELKSGGFRRPSILADCLEAILGAIYLDAGFDKVYQTVLFLYEPIIIKLDTAALGKDAKTLVQELLQKHQLSLPQYNVVARHGAAHLQEFEVECVISSLEICVSGVGTNRRNAEQTAARRALELIEKNLIELPSAKKKPRAKKTQLSLLGVATRQDPENE